MRTLGPSVSPTMVPPAPEYVDAFLVAHPPEGDEDDTVDFPEPAPEGGEK